MLGDTAVPRANVGRGQVRQLGGAEHGQELCAFRHLAGGAVLGLLLRRADQNRTADLLDDDAIGRKRIGLDLTFPVAEPVIDGLGHRRHRALVDVAPCPDLDDEIALASLGIFLAIEELLTALARFGISVVQDVTQVLHLHPGAELAAPDPSGDLDREVHDTRSLFLLDRNGNTRK